MTARDRDGREKDGGGETHGSVLLQFGLTSIKLELRGRDRGNESHREGREYCRMWLDLLFPTVTQGTTNLRRLVVQKVLSTAPNS